MNDIVRAWKDESYRQSLSVEEQGLLPANPAGEIELTDTELETVYGAFSGGFGGFEAEDNRQWNFSGGFFVEDYSCNRVSGGEEEFEPGFGSGSGSRSRGGRIAGRISNRNTNTATSTSTSTATGGTASATVGPITIPLVTV